MKIIKVFIVLLIIQISFNKTFAQTYIKPSLGVGLSTINNDENKYTFTPVLENKVENFYSLGLGIDHFLSKRFSGEIFSRYDRLRLSTSGGIQDNHSVPLNSEYYPVYSYLKNVFSFGGMMKYIVLERWQILSGISYIRHAKISYRETQPDELSDKMSYKEDNREMSLIIGCSYALPNNLQLSLLGQKIFWQNSTSEFLYLNPTFSISLQLSYSFKVLDKLKKKSKVACPKL